MKIGIALIPTRAHAGVRECVRECVEQRLINDSVYSVCVANLNWEIIDIMQDSAPLSEVALFITRRE